VSLWKDIESVFSVSIESLRINNQRAIARLLGSFSDGMR